MSTSTPSSVAMSSKEGVSGFGGGNRNAGWDAGAQSLFEATRPNQLAELPRVRCGVGKQPQENGYMVRTVAW